MKKLVTLLTVLTVLALVGTGCAKLSNDELQKTAKHDDSVVISEVNGFSALNNQTAAGNADVNNNINYLINSGFNYVNNDLEIVENKDFGKIEKISDNPLRVKYTLTDKAQWNDGTPVTADDLVLAWAVASGYYNDATGSGNEKSSKGKGTLYFNPANDTKGIDATEFPEIGADNKSMTLTYDRPFADWEIIIGNANAGGIGRPAHIVAKRAGIGSAADLTKLFSTSDKGDPKNPKETNKALEKVAKVWNEDYLTTSFPEDKDKDLLVSNGAYKITGIQEEQSVTLEKDKNFKAGKIPEIPKIVVRTISNGGAQIQALNNGEIDIISPQTDADTIPRLKAIDNITFSQYSKLSYEHVDLSFSGVFKDKKVREAFIKTIPRDGIMDTIVKPIDPNAKPLDSRMLYPEQDGYKQIVNENDSQQYQDQDIAAAKELLSDKKPTIRILYNRDNQNRRDSFEMIQQAAQDAGFKVEDAGAGASEWSGQLGGNSYDVAISGWVSSLGVGTYLVPKIYRTGAGLNYNNFSEKKVDSQIDKLIETTNSKKQQEYLTEIDREITDSQYGIPLYQWKGVTAHTDRVTGLKDTPIGTGPLWNYWEWKIKESS